MKQFGLCWLLCTVLLTVLSTSSVDAKCSPSRIYNAQVTLSIDTMDDPSTFLMPMDPERYSLQYEADAVAHWLHYFGINVTENTGKWSPIFPFKTNPNVRYSILSMSVVDPASGNMQMARTPISNAFTKDDGFAVILLEPVTLYGVYGGMDGVTIVGGSYLLYGQYRFFATCDDGTEYQFERSITYKAICPMTPVDYSGTGHVDPTLATMPFQCEVEHPVWGTGTSTGVSIYMAMPGMMPSMSPMRMNKVVTVMQFPGTLMDLSPDATYCEDIIPQNDICVPYYDNLAGSPDLNIDNDQDSGDDDGDNYGDTDSNYN